MSLGFYPCLTCAEEFNSAPSLNQHEVDSNHVTRPALKADKRKARQAYLEALYKNKVLVEKADRDASVQNVTFALKEIMMHVRRQYGGDLYGNEIRKAGSHSSGTKVQMADEFDFNIPLSFSIGSVSQVSHVPYIFEDKLYARQETEASIYNLNVPRKLIRHPGGGQKVPEGYSVVGNSESSRPLAAAVSFDGDIIARKVQEDLYTKIKEAIRSLNIRDLDLSRDSHGPAITLTMKKYGVHHISIDVTATIDNSVVQITQYGWPRHNTLETLRSDHIQRVIEAGTHLVPKGGEFWNISFSKAEKALMHGIDSGNECRRMCHKILKSDFKTWQSRSRKNGLKGISSYLFKHQMFWMNEEKCHIPGYWGQGKLETCYMDMLSDLQGRRRDVNRSTVYCEMAQRVAVVTGGNKGIGYAIVRGLCKQFDGDVFLTARDEKRGMDALDSLTKEGLPKNPRFHQLDITDDNSIKRLRDFLKENYGGLDVLVNNAGIAYKQNSTAPFGEQAEVTIATNYFGTLAVCNHLFELLRPHARVVNVSSMSSTFSIKNCSSEVKGKFISPSVTIEKCSAYLNEFIEAAKKGDHQEKGYANSAYGMSKVGVSAVTTIQAKEMDKVAGKDIIINSCCPGYVDTDMTSHKGPKTIDQGADTPLYLALLPPDNSDNPKGCFLSDRKVKDWAA